MNVNLPPNTPVDLYVATGVSVGTQIKVTVTGGGDVRLAMSQAGLTNDYITLKTYMSADNSATDTGAWALSTSGAGVNVREV